MDGRSHLTQHAIEAFFDTSPSDSSSPGSQGSQLGKRPRPDNMVSPSPPKKRGPCSPRLGPEYKPLIQTPSPKSFHKAFDEKFKQLSPTKPKASSPPSSSSQNSVKLTPEMLARIEENKRKALEKRQQRALSQHSLPLSKTQTPKLAINPYKKLSPPKFSMTQQSPNSSNTIGNNLTSISASQPQKLLPKYPKKNISNYPVQIIDKSKALPDNVLKQQKISLPKPSPIPNTNSHPINASQPNPSSIGYSKPMKQQIGNNSSKSLYPSSRISSQQITPPNNNNTTNISKPLYPVPKFKSPTTTIPKKTDFTKSKTNESDNNKKILKSKNNSKNTNLNDYGIDFSQPITPKIVTQANIPSHKPSPLLKKAISNTPKKKKSSSFQSSSSSSSKNWSPMRINQRESTKLGDSMETSVIESCWGDTSSKKKDKWHWLTYKVDSRKRKPSDPDYDPTTLYIPESSLLELTENQQVYWTFKKDHFDTIVFYQGGSFYELYGPDAILGAQLFDMKISQRLSSMPMVGFPTHSYEKFASKFVALGYKVARMDQYVNPETGNLEKRILGDYVTRGTLIDSPLLGDESDYLMSIFEDQKKNQFGICFIDCSLGKVYLGYFQDDRHHTKLKTLILQIKPREIIYLSKNLSNRTIHWIKKLNDPVFSPMSKDKSIVWTSNYVNAYLNDYFQNILSNEIYNHYSNNELTLSAFGGCIKYLSELQDKDKMILEQEELFDYSVIETGENSLILDGETLLNLEILQNSLDLSSKRTLFSVVMNCNSGIGKRLFSYWICHPLYKIDDINERLDAVEELIDQQDIVNRICNVFKKLPDLDRLLSRIHTGSITLKSALSFLEGLEEIIILIESYGYSSDILMDDSISQITSSMQEPYKFKSSYLKRITTLISDGGEFPPIHDKVAKFSDGIDREASLQQNLLLSNPGFNEEYDIAVNQVNNLKLKIDENLEDLKRKIGISNISYKHTAKQKYQIEIPNKYIDNSIKIPDNLLIVKKLKSVTRYYDPSVSLIIAELTEAEENLQVVAANQLHLFVEQLDEMFSELKQAINCIAQLDCLVSLSIASSASGFQTMSRPKFTEKEESFLILKDMVHPFLNVGQDNEVIPNDIIIGGDNPRAILLTGPNMGGKSTLLRQACLAIIMAQLGCFVPASYCELSPVDRIFTRIGANDNIFEGQSTFMVELEETAQILHNSTSKSFVILDELGRGTSTFDGTAIAHSVLHYLLKEKRTLLMFATHYHLLVEDWKDDKELALYHMSCFEDLDENIVTFLYKSVEGACPSSRGMNVARMAKIPESIVLTAEKISRSFEISFGTSRKLLTEKILSYINESISSGNISSNLLEIWDALNTQYTRK